MLGTYEKRKERRVLTKSRTSSDPSEERRVSLGEFGETKDFGIGIKADQYFGGGEPFFDQGRFTDSLS